MRAGKAVKQSNGGPMTAIIPSFATSLHAAVKALVAVQSYGDKIILRLWQRCCSWHRCNSSLSLQALQPYLCLMRLAVCNPLIELQMQVQVVGRTQIRRRLATATKLARLLRLYLWIPLHLQTKARQGQIFLLHMA